MDFKSIVQQIIPDDFEQRKCPDQYVGKIGDFVSDSGDFPCRERIRERNQKCIIMVLESPHIKEYIDRVGPAKGKTGGLIRQKIQTVLRNHILDLNDYGLFLMNAVQYQCSLGYPTHRFRDMVFLSAWQSGGADKFKDRLASLYEEGDVILNSCTQGLVSPYLRVQVQEVINSFVITNERNCRVLETNHPASWFSNRNHSVR